MDSAINNVLLEAEWCSITIWLFSLVFIVSSVVSSRFCFGTLFNLSFAWVHPVASNPRFWSRIHSQHSLQPTQETHGSRCCPQRSRALQPWDPMGALHGAQPVLVRPPCSPAAHCRAPYCRRASPAPSSTKPLQFSRRSLCLSPLALEQAAGRAVTHGRSAGFQLA